MSRGCCNVRHQWRVIGPGAILSRKRKWVGSSHHAVGADADPERKYQTNHAADHRSLKDSVYRHYRTSFDVLIDYIIFRLILIISSLSMLVPHTRVSAGEWYHQNISHIVNIEKLNSFDIHLFISAYFCSWHVCVLKRNTYFLPVFVSNFHLLY